MRAEKGGAGRNAWLTLGTAASVTVNSPETLCAVYDYAAKRSEGVKGGVEVAAGMREVALKCISFNGVSRDGSPGLSSLACLYRPANWQIPRTINALNVLRAHWPEDVVAGLSTESTRYVDHLNAFRYESSLLKYVPAHSQSTQSRQHHCHFPKGPIPMGQHLLPLTHQTHLQARLRPPRSPGSHLELALWRLTR